MKQVLAGILLALAGSGAWAAGYPTGSDMYKMCSDSVSASECNYYVSGVLDGMEVQSWYNKTAPCIDRKRLSVIDIKNMFVGYLAKHKDRFDEPAAALLLEAVGAKDCSTP